jgi:hypothetical protein
MDLLIIAVVAASFAAALEWVAVPAFAAFVLVYVLLRQSRLKLRRQREAARIDYLLDKDYFLWRAALDRKRDAP